MDKNFIYVNEASVLSNIHEFSFKLNTVLPVEDESGEVTTEIINSQYVSMSPQHAKDFADALNKQIEYYEKNHGPILSTSHE